MATIQDFDALDIRAGTVVAVDDFPKARKPAYRLTIDLGELGVKHSSAQITSLYTKEELVGRQVLCVVNLPPRQIADFMSEVLTLGLPSDGGVVLIGPERPVENGSRLFRGIRQSYASEPPDCYGYICGQEVFIMVVTIRKVTA